MKEYLRHLPPVHELQKKPQFLAIMEKYGLHEKKITDIIQLEIEQIRTQILAGNWEGAAPTEADFIDRIFDQTEQRAEKSTTYYLHKLINATGTILHTNLGRARLSETAIKHMVEVAQNYSNLEYNIEEGKRGSRHDIIEMLIKEVTGAEAAMVVNNNAAAVYLILRALAKDQEVIVSRGQLVEIGGSFRISAIMEESGATLKEVGTTNKTHLYDYEQALNEATAMVMKVHTSNFKTIGFTETVETDELVKLAKSAGVYFYEDLGSGVLYDFKQHGIGDEPVVGDVLKQGADIVSFSGDKLLGGPQAGIIAGKKELITKLKRHQLARVLRVDKMTFAALEATLLAYVKGGNSRQAIPTVRDLLNSVDQIKSRAIQFCEVICTQANLSVHITEATSQVGGGTMPEVFLPTVTVEMVHSQMTSEQLSRKLRFCNPGIVSRLKDDKVVLDFRTITAEEVEPLIQAVVSLP